MSCPREPLERAMQQAYARQAMGLPTALRSINLTRTFARELELLEQAGNGQDLAMRWVEYRQDRDHTGGKFAELYSFPTNSGTVFDPTDLVLDAECETVADALTWLQNLDPEDVWGPNDE